MHWSEGHDNSYGYLYKIVHGYNDLYSTGVMKESGEYQSWKKIVISEEFIEKNDSLPVQNNILKDLFFKRNNMKK